MQTSDQRLISYRAERNFLSYMSRDVAWGGKDPPPKVFPCRQILKMNSVTSTTFGYENTLRYWKIEPFIFFFPLFFLNNI